jgi:hypothetical protein
MKLLNRIIENSDTKINVLPECPVGPNKVLNSLCNIINTLFHRIWCREGINQYIGGIIIKPIKVLIQLREKLKMFDEGSNTENKLVIIFN